MCVYQNLLRVLYVVIILIHSSSRYNATMSLTPLHSDSIENLFLRLYSFDAISLFVDILEYLSKRCSELSVDLHTQDERQLRSKKILILKFEIIAKVCHYIENFRAFGYSFSKTRPSRDLIRESL
jgi:hypothetical protein